MSLQEVILKNEKIGRKGINRLLIRNRLRFLVQNYKTSVLEAMKRTGERAYSHEHKSILYNRVLIAIKRNPRLKEAIARMLLSMDTYSEAGGSTLGIIGGALSAVGGILGGIANSKKEEESGVSQEELRRIELENQRRKEEEEAKRKRTYLFIGVGVLILIVVGFFIYKSRTKTVVS